MCIYIYTVYTLSDMYIYILYVYIMYVYMYMYMYMYICICIYIYIYMYHIYIYISHIYIYIYTHIYIIYITYISHISHIYIYILFRICIHTVYIYIYTWFYFNSLEYYGKTSSSVRTCNYWRLDDLQPSVVAIFKLPQINMWIVPGAPMFQKPDFHSYPLVNVYITNINMERSTMFKGKIHYKCWFSIVMSVYQRVPSNIIFIHFPGHLSSVVPKAQLLHRPVVLIHLTPDLRAGPTGSNMSIHHPSSWKNVIW